MKMRLGQEAVQALKDAETCLNIGRSYTQVDCGLAYAEYILKKPHGKVDLDDVSTGIFTAAKSAEGLKKLSPPQMHTVIDEFITGATKLNKNVRDKWVFPPKDEKTKKQQPKEPFTEGDFKSLRSKAESLRGKADGIFASLRGLCTYKPASVPVR